MVTLSFCRLSTTQEVGVLPLMIYWKGYLFQASGMYKERDFTGWRIWKVGKSVFLFPEKPKRANNALNGCEKSKKCSEFVIDSYLKDSAFISVKRDAKFSTRYVKGVPFFNRRYTKGVPFLWKMLHKRVRGWTVGRSLAILNLVEYPPGYKRNSNINIVNACWMEKWFVMHGTCSKIAYRMI